MKSIYFIIPLIVGILLFAGGQSGCQQGTETEFDYSSLTMSFVEGAPPAEINYGEQFPIFLSVKNYGGYNVPVNGVKFYLTGLGQNLNGVTTTLSNSNLLNKRDLYQDGGSETIVFAERATPAVSLQNSFSFTMRLDSCYEYRTSIEAPICVGNGDAYICSISGNKMDDGTSTAGPIQVENITEIVEGNKLYVFFTLVNNGGGDVYLRNSDCDLLQSNDITESLKKGMVDVLVRTGEPGFTCRLQSTEAPYGTVDTLTGVSSMGRVACVKTLESPDTHLSSLEIELAYRYWKTLSHALTILPA
ncbi:MAG: hypothetical protein ABH817_01155 [archaeon]